MRRKAHLSEEEMLINKDISHLSKPESSSGSNINSKWYDSWSYLNCIISDGIS